MRMISKELMDMKHVKAKINSIMITGVLIVSVLAISIPVKADETPVIELSKKVWDPQTERWADTLSAHVNDIVRYNISIRYVGSDFLSIYNIRIMDYLPSCLQYISGSAVFINDAGQTPVETLADGVIYWDFIGSHQLVLDSEHSTMHIIYGARVLFSTTDSSNIVTVNARYGSTQIQPVTTSLRITIKPFTLEKLVKNRGESWRDNTSAINGDTINFKLKTIYYGVYNATNIKIVDHLPGNLIYSSLNTPNSYIEVSNDRKTIWVNITDVTLNLSHQSVEVEFKVDVVDCEPGLLINTAYASAEIEDAPIEICVTDSDSAIVNIIPNQPPLTPLRPGGDIEVRGYGIVGVTYYFTTITIDPNDDQVYYLFTWNDGTDSGWIGPYNSGAVGAASHAWSTPGIKIIRAKAKDSRGMESQMTDVDPEHSLYILILSSDIGHVNHPPLTPGRPSGNSTGSVGERLTFMANTTDPDPNDRIQYLWDWNNDSVTDYETDPAHMYASGENCVVTHVFNTPGVYHVRVKARDLDGLESGWSYAKIVTITGNHPPSIPVIRSGPSRGLVNTSYEFTANTTDIDGNNVSYNFSWGDGTYSGWTRFYRSGEIARVNHTWRRPGSYSVKVKAKDVYGAESNWSAVKTITINESSIINITITNIKGGFGGVSATIKNTGNEEVSNINWSISVKSKRSIKPISASINGTISKLGGDDSEVVGKLSVRGFGRVKINVKVMINSDLIDEESKDGFVFFFYVIVSK